MFTIQIFQTVIPSAMVIAAIFLLVYYSIQYWRNRAKKSDLFFLAISIIFCLLVLKNLKF